MESLVRTMRIIWRAELLIIEAKLNVAAADFLVATRVLLWVHGQARGRSLSWRAMKSWP